jgi:hypothetical protein
MLDKGAIALVLFQQAIMDHLDGDRQIPLHERCPMAECPGFSFEHGKVMPGITKQLTATEAARVVSDDVLVGHNADSVGGEPDRDYLIGPLGRYAIAITVSRHQTLGTDAT